MEVKAKLRMAREVVRALEQQQHLNRLKKLQSLKAKLEQAEQKSRAYAEVVRGLRASYVQLGGVLRGGNGDVPKREHVRASEKLAVAGNLYGVLHTRRGKRVSAGELAAHSAGLKVRELVKIWNDAHPKKQIRTGGVRGGKRYWLD